MPSVLSVWDFERKDISCPKKKFIQKFTFLHVTDKQNSVFRNIKIYNFEIFKKFLEPP